MWKIFLVSVGLNAITTEYETIAETAVEALARVLMDLDKRGIDKAEITSVNLRQKEGNEK